MPSYSRSSCRCFLEGPERCPHPDGEQVIKGVRLPRFSSRRSHALNRLQKWAITTRANDQPVPVYLLSLVEATNGAPFLVDTKGQPVSWDTRPGYSDPTWNSQTNRPRDTPLGWQNVASAAPQLTEGRKASQYKSSYVRGFTHQESLLDYALITATDQDSQWPWIEGNIRVPCPSAFHPTGSDGHEALANLNKISMNYFQRTMYHIATDEALLEKPPSFDYDDILDGPASETWGRAEIAKVMATFPSDLGGDVSGPSIACAKRSA